MKTKKICSTFTFLFLLFLPFTAIAEEMITEVLVVINTDEILAFSGPKGNWVSHRLKPQENVLSEKTQGNVAVVITNERIFGFSVFSGKWNVIVLKINEVLEDIQVEGNVATVTTDQRVFGFAAQTGKWVAVKKIPSFLK